MYRQPQKLVGQGRATEKPAEGPKNLSEQGAKPKAKRVTAVNFSEKFSV
jgi:hypothetical protein